MDDNDRRILDFEATHPGAGVHKDNAIRKEFGMGAVRYQQILGRVITTREALEAHPMIVHRWERRMRIYEARRAARVFG